MDDRETCVVCYVRMCPKCGHFFSTITQKNDEDLDEYCSCGTKFIKLGLTSKEYKKNLYDYASISNEKRLDYLQYLIEKYCLPMGMYDPPEKLIIREYGEDYKNNPLYIRRVNTRMDWSEFEKEEPKIKCPTCGSTDVRKVSTSERTSDAILFGIFGNRRNKQFHCNYCNYEW